MNTGHDGSLSTGHANSPKDMLTRLETMVLMGMDMPVSAIRAQISSAIDIIVHLAIVIYLKVTAKEFIQPLYGNIAGIIIMTVCLAVYVVSDMWAKRIVNIEV